MTTRQRELDNQRTVIVAGAQGVSGRAVLERYATSPGTAVYGLSRRPAKGEGNVRHISVDLLDADDGRDFGRGTGFQLGVDADRMPFNMPVNHDAFTAVAHVPLRHEVLIPSAELFGVRCAGRRRLAPDMRQANPKHRIDNLRNGFAEGLLADETSAHIDQIGVAFGPSAATYALQSSVRAQPVQEGVRSRNGK
jgi:hypothetical protein